EFVADRKGKKRFDPSLKIGPRISAAALQEGLIARAMPHGDILGFSPPLVISPEEVDEMIARARRALNKMTDELVREGQWKAAWPTRVRALALAASRRLGQIGTPARGVCM